VPLGGLRGEGGHRRVDAVPADQHRRDRLDGGVRSEASRQRERIVGSRSSTLGAHSSRTLCGGGSSTALSTVLEVRSSMRSASSMRVICHRPRVGAREDRR
jgi:hypothetical protein